MSFYLNFLYDHFPGFWFGLLGILGLIIGSFINVVIHRYPIMLKKYWKDEATELLGLKPSMSLDSNNMSYNLLSPCSSCINCNTPIKWFDNIPVISWLVLKGHCRYCHCKISFRYPLVEIICAIMITVVSYYFRPDVALFGAIIFSCLLLCMAFIDLENFILPDNFTLLLLWVGLLFNCFEQYVPLKDAILGAIAGYFFLWTIFWIFKLITDKSAMGYGDFKLFAAIGAWVGYQWLIYVLLLASVTGVIVTLLLACFTNRKTSEPIAFGVYLAFSGWLFFVNMKMGLIPQLVY